MQPPSPPIAPRRPKVVNALIETFGFSPWLASLTALFIMFLGAAALLWVWLSAPPRSVTIISGPPGSTFERNAIAYQKLLAEQDIVLNIVPSGGSLDNLRRLQAKDSEIDLGFVQGGLLGGEDPPPSLVSLGSIAVQPLWVFYRGTAKIERLSELAGKRIGIGAVGSGVQLLARALLGANGINGAPTTLDEQPTDVASKAFQAGQLDAVFMMGDSAPMQTVRTFLRASEIQVFNFTQADAYVRRLGTLNLNKIVIPQGGFDLGQNLPAQDITLVGPGVELIARKGLNDALTDMVLLAAQEVHGKPTLLAKKGEFPAPLDREYEISSEAKRFYKSGMGYTFKLTNSYWLSSLINRLLVAVVPFLLIVIPAIRFFPVMYRWSVHLRIYRCYRPLLRLERSAETPLAPAHAKEMLEQLDAIEADVAKLAVPASFAQQYYDLRTHVVFVRNRLKAAAAG